MAKVFHGKRPAGTPAKTPAKKSKRIPVNKNGKITKSKKKATSRKGKGKVTAASRAKDKALAIAKSYPRGKTRAELVEWMGPRKRANSRGLFGSTPPPKPTRIDISNGVIMHDCAKKTILGIVRGFWPNGAYTWTDINDKYPKWFDKVHNEFYKYFRHEKGQSRNEAKLTLAAHLQALIKRTVHEEKVCAYANSKKFKKPLLEVNPGYFSDPVWEGMVRFWESEQHMLRSDKGKENRKLVTTLHSAGARSFQQVEKILTEEKNGVVPTRLEVWDKTHTRKEKDANGLPVYTTEAAKEIALSYAKILEEKNFDPTSENVVEPYDWWLLATVGAGEKPKNNRLLGFPRISARKLIKDVSVQYDEGAENRAESSAAGAARNRGNIPSKIFADVVGGVIDILKTNPSTYQRQLNAEEVENLARAALDLSDPGNRIEFSQFISNEVLHLVKQLVEDMFKSYNEKEKEVMDNSDEEDVTDISDDEADEEGHNGDMDGAGGGSEGENGEIGEDEDCSDGSDREDD